MENKNINVNVNINVNNIAENNIAEAQTRSSESFKITENTTLRELIDMLNLGEKPPKTPTATKLCATAGDPIVRTSSILVYQNGYAVYDNGSGRTVMWLPDCISFIYIFDPLRDSEKEIVPDKVPLPEGLLESLYWEIAVTLIGDHRVEANSMNRVGSRKGTKDFESEDDGDKDDDAEEAMDKFYEKEFAWIDNQISEDPETIYIRKEAREEMLAEMTDKQREVFILYYYNGYTQKQISEYFHTSRQNITQQLQAALNVAKKYVNIL